MSEKLKPFDTKNRAQKLWIKLWEEDQRWRKDLPTQAQSKITQSTAADWKYDEQE